MKTKDEIRKVQAALRARYTNYDKLVDNLRKQTGNDEELLASMADDRDLCHMERMFAVAAMGVA